jgi:threonine dehydrogenase-like Zn-dependent dehydrogenase
MKAAIYYGQKDVRLEELETPAAGDNDIVVKNLYASICGTDVAVYLHGPNTGHRITVGSEFGHEMVSEVVQVGKNVKGIEAGMLVYPYPRLAKGDPRRAGTVGGFSEYVLIPGAELGRQVYAVPAGIPAREACLIEPFTVGFRAARRSEPKPGENAIVFGAGTIGIAAAIGLKYFGCKEVMLCDHSDFRLEKAKTLGFAVCNNSREDLKEAAMAVFGTAPSRFGPTANVPIYIDAAGAEPILELYQSMGKIESRMVVVAVRAGKRPVDVLEMTYSQHALIGSGGYNPEDVEDVIAVMAKGKWDIESIITDEFPQEQLTQAIERAADVDHALNVVIRYE